jgi:hypothetical protein
MKKICLLSLAILTAACINACAATIHSYEELTEAMRKGDRFVFLLDLAQCTGKAGMPTGYYTPSTMMLVPATEKAPERVVTSHLQFTDHSGTPAYEYVKYTFHADNTVMVRTAFYDPQSFKPMGEPHMIKCTVDNGLVIKKS